MEYNVHEAKSNLSRLLDAAEAGEEVVISRRGRPVVRLQRIQIPTGRVLGLGRGEVALPDDAIWNSMTEEEVEAFVEGRS